MNTKDNQRSRLTRKLLKQAYIELMREKNAGRITVKDICAGAEVNRSTFYLHFSEPNDILIELEDEVIAQIAAHLRTIGTSFDSDVREYIVSFLEYVRQQDALLPLFLVENTDLHFRRKLFELAMKMMDSSFDIPMDAADKQYACRFIVSGSIELLAEWIRSDYAMPKRALRNILYGLCKGCLEYMPMGSQ